MSAPSPTSVLIDLVHYRTSSRAPDARRIPSDADSAGETSWAVRVNLTIDRPTIARRIHHARRATESNCEDLRIDPSDDPIGRSCGGLSAKSPSPTCARLPFVVRVSTAQAGDSRRCSLLSDQFRAARRRPDRPYKQPDRVCRDKAHSSSVIRRHLYGRSIIADTSNPLLSTDTAHAAD